MNALIRKLTLIGLLLSSINAFGQCELTGYADCVDAAQNTYNVIIDVSGIDPNDVVSIAGFEMSKVDGSNILTFGPFSHSGTGLAHQQVLLNGTECVDILETLCGYYTGNGLHASGSGCVNVDNASTGFILAQSQPGTFQNNDENSQHYILSDGMKNYVDDNSTGYFPNLIPGDYNLHAVNVVTDEASIFQSGLSEASDLEEYLNTSTSCLSICGSVQYTVGCSSTPIDVYINPDLEDPCSCTNPLNVLNDDFTIRFMHDVITVTQADDLDSWVFRNPSTDFYIQTSPDVYELVTDGTAIPGIGNGMFSIEIYHTPAIGWASDFMATSGPNAGFEIKDKSNVCMDCIGVQIPTMSQWALFILAMLLINIGLVKVYNHRELLAA